MPQESPPPHAARAPARALVLVWLVWALASLGAVTAALGALHIDRSGTLEGARDNLHALGWYWAASASGWAALTALWLGLRRRPARGTPASAARSTWLIVGVALAARIVVLAVHDPGLSDDVYRYAFDGGNLARGINPYLVRPADRLAAAEEAWPGEAELAGRVNNPHMHTVYLPASEWVFAAAGILMPDAGSDPQASARLVRAVFVLFDMGVIGLILAALSRSGRSPWWAALYAWHPLAVTEIAASGHQESLGIALLVGAIYLGASAPKGGVFWTALWTGLLALATLVKPVVVPVAAFLLKGRPWRAWAQSLVLGTGVCLLVAAPLLLSHDLEPLEHLRDSAERFRLKWAHFGPVYEPLLWTIEQLRPLWTNDDQEVLARRICTVLVLAIIAGVWWRGPASVWAQTRIMLVAMVLLSPAAHPWYLLWALALVPMSFGTAAWVASLTLPWGYYAWANVSPDGVVEWGTPPWLMVAAWAPVYAACLVAAARSRRR